MGFILSHCKVSLESTSGTECHKGDGFLQGIGIYHVQIPDHEHEHFDTIRLLTNCGTWCSTCKTILFGGLWNETRCKQKLVHLLSGGKKLAYFGIWTEPLLVTSISGHQDDSTVLDAGFSWTKPSFPMVLHPHIYWFCFGVLFSMNKKVGILTPPKPNTTMQQQAFEDVKSPKKWWFSVVMLVFWVVNMILSPNKLNRKNLRGKKPKPPSNLGISSTQWGSLIPPWNHWISQVPLVLSIPSLARMRSRDSQPWAT